jgi:hypothetical protein
MSIQYIMYRVPFITVLMSYPASASTIRVVVVGVDPVVISDLDTVS